ncbi:D-2-hydroxyacid dehydrogenase [Paenarthrobacter sp. NPDC090520]|uniref:D-2-hydroxyacid dehydrogenase n=1 Tax=unclassified Paenarthrobacter TaxID=2634190 RepID=UPI0038305326
MSKTYRPHIVILTAEHLSPPNILDDLSKLARITLTDSANLSGVLKEADALLIWDFFSNALECAWAERGDLRWVHVAAAGVDAVLFDELRHSGVTVTNAHGIFDSSIAEFVLASILAHDKQLHRSKWLQQHKKWEHREITRTAGTTALVVGTGGIGRAVARLLMAVGINVRGIGRRTQDLDPDFGTVSASTELGVHASWADTIVLAAPLTSATAGLVGKDVLDAMKPSAHLINVGRGGLIDELALIEALQSGGIGHASLDVFDVEPLVPGHPFWLMENVTISAHMSGDVAGWRDALAEQFLQNVRAFNAGRRIPNEIDKNLGYVPQAPARGT